MNRTRIVAASARVAVPWGTRVKAVRPVIICPFHSAVGPLVDLVGICIVCQICSCGGVITLVLGVAHHHGCHFLAGDAGIGTEFACASTIDNTGRGCPGYRIRIPSSSFGIVGYRCQTCFIGRSIRLGGNGYCNRNAFAFSMLASRSGAEL